MFKISLGVWFYLCLSTCECMCVYMSCKCVYIPHTQQRNKHTEINNKNKRNRQMMLQSRAQALHSGSACAGEKPTGTVLVHGLSLTCSWALRLSILAWFRHLHRHYLKYECLTFNVHKHNMPSYAYGNNITFNKSLLHTEIQTCHYTNAYTHTHTRTHRYTHTHTVN